MGFSCVPDRSAAKSGPDLQPPLPEVTQVVGGYLIFYVKDLTYDKLGLLGSTYSAGGIQDRV